MEALHDQMRVRILGPVEADVDGRWILPGPLKQRAVLATLALNAGNTVPMSTIVDTLWAHDPPPSAVKNVQLYVWRLRRLLGDLIQTHPPGYRLPADAVDLDVNRFTTLVDLARRARQQAQPTSAMHHFAQALALWRGPALADLVAAGLAANLARPLAAERARVIHELVEVELVSGAASDLLPRLEAWVLEDPLDERLRELQIQALLAAGRPAQALGAYIATESTLAADLGTGPGPALRALANSVRQAMKAKASPPDTAVPRQLPPAPATFIGRRAQVAGLADLLAPRIRSVPVVAIVGPGGIGKSALAIRVAHRIASTFHGGQLYLDLQGASAGLDPIPAGEALPILLRGLGIDPQDIPTSLPEATALYRSRTAGRNVLVVLDNAADTDQIRPLLPGSGGSALLLTSRHSMADLDGVTHLHLDPLPVRDAVGLLTVTLGRQRIRDEPDEQLVQLVQACGALPLALRVAGARLASRPSWSVAAFNRRLADERGRLNELRTADVAVRTSFGLSYQHLAPAAQLVFRCCGLFPGPDFTAVTIAVLAGLDESVVADLLEDLVDESLLHSGEPGRYHLHDLLRIYAAECAYAHDGEPVVRSRFARLAEWYLRIADTADRMLLPMRGRTAVEYEGFDLPAAPPLGDRAQALDWFETERRNLCEVVRASARQGLHKMAWQLPLAMKGFLELRRYTDDWVGTHEIGLASVRRCDDLYGYARVLNGLGSGYWRLDRLADAADCYQQALTMIRGIGDRRTEAILLCNLGVLRGETGDYQAAIDYLRQALRIRDQVGSQLDESFALNNLGHVYHECGRYEEALPLLNQALQVRRAQRNPHGEGITLHCLADTLLGLDRPLDADRAAREALSIATEEANRYGQAAALHTLGRIRLAQGLPDEAAAHLRQAIAMYRDMDTGREQAKAESDLLRVGGPAGAAGTRPAR